MSKGFKMPVFLMAEYIYIYIFIFIIYLYIYIFIIAKYAFAVHCLPAYSPYLRDP